jgi:hypothetical protein
MKTATIPAILGALVLTAGTVSPAQAETATYLCPNRDAYVSGSTEHNGQITYLAGTGFGHCKTLGIRVYYSHVGGASWTSWKYSAYGGAYVSRNVGSPIKSRHSAWGGDILFTTQNG